MSPDLFSIGDVARSSGLSMSALRFYDREAILIPVTVDPLTGYRWYSSNQVRSAELIAKLRRVGLALPEISQVLALSEDENVLRRVLADHVYRLEAGLASAKSLINEIERTWTTASPAPLSNFASVNALEFHRALTCVRFAAGGNHDYPGLAGVCLIANDGRLQVLASDRHRAAFDSLRIESETVRFKVVLAPAGLDELLSLLIRGGVAHITLNSNLQIRIGDDTCNCPLLDLDFPDFTVPSQTDARSATAEVDRNWIRTELRKRPRAKERRVGLDYEGQLHIDNDDQATELALLLNASYLSEAVEAARGDQLSFELNGPIAPLAIRSTQNPHSFSVIMPILKD